MSTTSQPAATSPKWMVWTGWIVSVLPALALLMSASMKFLQPPEMAEGFEHLGWPMHLAIVLGILEAGCTVIYLIPPTAVLGAILVTGYLGGAVATHVRIGEQCVPQVTLGVIFWLGLWLRDARLRALLPWRS